MSAPSRSKFSLTGTDPLVAYDPEFGMGDHMFNDLALSRDLMREYNAQRARLGYGEATQKLSVMVLQRSFWPFAARKQDVLLPTAVGAPGLLRWQMGPRI